MTEYEIALCVIAGDNALDEGFERMLDSVVGKVHGVFVSFNGTDDAIRTTLMAAIDERFGNGAIVVVPWREDFAEQRNASFDLARKFCLWDWLFWLDCDDVLAEHSDLQLACRTLIDKRAHGGFLDYVYDTDSETGDTLAQHVKERLFRADVAWHWAYPVHENCLGPIATRMTEIGSEIAVVIHNRRDSEAKRHRNARIIKAWYDQVKDTEPRATMMLAHATKAAADDLEGTARVKAYGAALRLYRQYIDYTPADDDSYVCNRECAEILRKLGKFDEALDIDLQGVKIKPNWPASYNGIAETYFAMGAYEDAVKWARNTRAVCKDPDTLHGWSPLDTTYKPLMIEGHALMKLERFAEAHAAYCHALEHRDDDFTRGWLAAAEEEIRTYTYVDYNEVRKFYWGKAPDKSIAFWAGRSAEEWDRDTIADGGSGGTESTLLKVADHFNEQGWRVAIFANPLEEGPDDEGVEWWNAERFHPDEPFTVFVSLRSPMLFDADVKARRKILWLHDVAVGDQRYGEHGEDRFERVDAIVCPSLAHLRHTVAVYNIDLVATTTHLVTIPNGIDYEQIAARRPEVDERHLSRCVYASSPDRGLLRLLELWPEINERMSGAKLEIFYGWEAIDALIAAGSPNAHVLRIFKARIQEVLGDLVSRGHAITWHGRVNQERLIDAMWCSSVMPYPADFFETFGIVFAQACACGVVPVVPNMGNLPQLAGDHLGIVVDGPPNSFEYAGRFIDAVQLAAEAPHGIRNALTESVMQFDWPRVLQAWDELITALTTEEAHVGVA